MSKYTLNSEVTKDENGQWYYGGQKMLVKYIRVWESYDNQKALDSLIEKGEVDGQMYKAGVVVALLNEGKVALGYSRCNLKADKWNRTLGLNVAVERALKRNVKPPFDDFRPEIEMALSEMYNRSRHYFSYLYVEIPPKGGLWDLLFAIFGKNNN